VLGLIGWLLVRCSWRGHRITIAKSRTRLIYCVRTAPVSTVFVSSRTCVTFPMAFK
jgi:hypothetical protein